MHNIVQKSTDDVGNHVPEAICIQLRNKAKKKKTHLHHGCLMVLSHQQQALQGSLILDVIAQTCQDFLLSQECIKDEIDTRLDMLDVIAQACQDFLLPQECIKYETEMKQRCHVCGIPFESLIKNEQRHQTQCGLQCFCQSDVCKMQIVH